MSNYTKISCPRCGIDHPYFSCDHGHGPPTPYSSSQFAVTTDLILSELLAENQKLGQELKEIKSLLASVVEELRKSNKKKVLED